MSIKNKVATAVATAGLLAGIFGSALVPAAMAGSVTSANTPKASKTYTYVYDDLGYVGDHSLKQVMDPTNTYKVHKFTMSTESVGHPKNWYDYIAFEIVNAAGDDITSLDTLSATISGGTVKGAWAFEGDTSANQNGEPVDDCSNAGTGNGDIPNGAWGATPSATTVSASDYDNEYDSNSVYILCLAALKPGKSTITVKANGVTLPVVTVDVFGKITSLTLSASGTSSLTEGNSSIDKFFTIVGKDAAGQVINDTDKTYADFDLTDWNDGNSFYYAGESDGSGLVSNQDGTDKEFVYNYDSERPSGSHKAANKMDISGTVCEAGDAGTSFSLAVETEAYNPYGSNSLVTSNAVTVKCTGDSTTAHVSALSVEATSGPLAFADGTDADGNLDVYATVVDDAGRLIGAGDGTYDFGQDMSALVEEGHLAWTAEYNDATDVAGKVIIGHLNPDMDHARKYGYKIKLSDSDFAGDAAGNDPVAFSKSFSYLAINADAVTYVPTVTMNKAKTTATIKVDFGVDCSNQAVTFDVELANGTVVYYDRTANIDGVATLSLSKRKTTVLVTVESCTDVAAVSTTKSITFK